MYEFVQDGYAGSFGAQWQEFARTQLDSKSGTRISEHRFAEVTGWTPADLRGKTVLDLGCGAGRFTEVAIKWGARVTAIDLSSAVHAARANVLGADQARFVQANALELPLRTQTFDLVFSIGVAQHTPDPGAFVQRGAEMVKPGGRAAFWIYERTLPALLRPKYLLRPLTKRLPQQWNRRFAEGLVSVFFPVAKGARALPRPLRRPLLAALPIAAYVDRSEVPEGLQREWSLLDTLDWYSPAHDHPQRFEDVERALMRGGARDVSRRRNVPGLTVSAAF